MTTALTKFDGTPSAHDPVLWRFVARVQALTPAEWGRLDALAAPINGRTPVAAARRLRLITPFLVEPWRQGARELGPEIVRTIRDNPWETLKFAVGLMRPSLWKNVKIGQRPDLPPDLPPEAKAEIDAIYARSEDDDRAWKAIRDAAAKQPLGMGAAAWAMTFANLAVWARDDLPPEVVTRMYAYVEPVIPYASLTSA